MLRSLCVFIALAGCGQEPGKPSKPAELPDMPAFKESGAKISFLNRNIWLDLNDKGRRVILRTTVCRRDVPLEEFMCLKGTKEHEAIVTADIVPKVFHAALIAAGAEPGTPAKYEGDKFEPARGHKLEITVEWKEQGKAKRAKAQDWLREIQSKKSTSYDFVFAGSQEVKNPVTGETYYLGNEGDLISVANFASSIVDIAVRSSDVDADHMFEAFKERIPEVDTEVYVILKPVAEKKGTTPTDKAPAESGNKK